MGFRWERNLGDIINPGYSHKPYRYAIDIPSIGFFFWGHVFFEKTQSMEYLWHIYGLWEYPGFMMVEFGISDFWRYDFEKKMT